MTTPLVITYSKSVELNTECHKYNQSLIFSSSVSLHQQKPNECHFTCFVTTRATNITHTDNSLTSHNAQSPLKMFSLQFDKFIRTLDSYPPIISLGDFTVINRTLFISVSTLRHISVSTLRHISVSTLRHISVSTLRHTSVSTLRHISVSTLRYISVSTLRHILVFILLFHAPGATFRWKLTAHKVYSRLFVCRLSSLRIIRARLCVADD